MPPRAVWKTRPSRAVPNRLMWARSSQDQDRGDGEGAGLIARRGVLQAALSTVRCPHPFLGMTVSDGRSAA